MKEQEIFKFPSTRYSGSKRRVVDWIWDCIKELKFDSVVDVFGGTASVSLMFKKQGKRVHYNDLLKFNMYIGTALIENSNTIVTDQEVEEILQFKNNSYPNFIQENYRGIFYLEEENEWLDKIVHNLSKVSNPFKKAILFSALFQACLAKRPFNLFHRANLYLRTNNVNRTFGNKTTWEHSFEYLLKRYVHEYNRAVFDNKRNNKVIGGYNAALCPNSVDLVYLDPPYFSSNSQYGTNYLTFYHFLEGLADYDNWPKKDPKYGKIKKMNDTDEILAWTRKSLIYHSFEEVIERFQDNIIVLSYQSKGIPTKEEIYGLLKKYKSKVKVFSVPRQYVLSLNKKDELLFVAT